MSYASLQNPLDLMPIQDKIHKYFPEKTLLITYNIHKFSPRDSFCFITHYAAHKFSLLKQGSQLLPKKSPTNTRQLLQMLLWIFRNFTKINTKDLIV